MGYNPNKRPPRDAQKCDAADVVTVQAVPPAKLLCLLVGQENILIRRQTVNRIMLPGLLVNVYPGHALAERVRDYLSDNDHCESHDLASRDGRLPSDENDPGGRNRPRSRHRPPPDNNIG